MPKKFVSYHPKHRRLTLCDIGAAENIEAHGAHRIIRAVFERDLPVLYFKRGERIQLRGKSVHGKYQ